ncbi:MAG: hypothetical protein VX228_09285 [Pseudomonadota bacterium]|nr:hypothetical protein [Pseudomonadota bacterium]
MADKPILFSGPMVCALLEGRKTQTRRVIRNVMQNYCITLKNSTKTKSGLETHVIDAPEYPRILPVKVTKGDRLWVRETWRPRQGFGAWDMRLRYPADDYEALLEDGDRDIGDWTWPKAANTGNVPAIHMPRWASRITLKVTDVRVERLQKITS